MFLSQDHKEGPSWSISKNLDTVLQEPQRKSLLLEFLFCFEFCELFDWHLV